MKNILFGVIIIWCLLSSILIIIIDNYHIQNDPDIEEFYYPHSFNPKKMGRREQLGSIKKIGDDMIISFYLKIHSIIISKYWSHILHIGNDNIRQRTPLIALHPNSTLLHTRFSTDQYWNQGYDYNVSLLLNKLYYIKLYVTQNIFILNIDNKTVINKTYNRHDVYKTSALIHPGGAWWHWHGSGSNPIYPPRSNVTVSELKIISTTYNDSLKYPFKKYIVYIAISMVIVLLIGVIIFYYQFKNFVYEINMRNNYHQFSSSDNPTTDEQMGQMDDSDLGLFGHHNNECILIMT